MRYLRLQRTMIKRRAQREEPRTPQAPRPEPNPAPVTTPEPRRNGENNGR